MAIARRLPVVATLPRSLYLETTNRCDSKCQTCIRTFQSLEPPADLTLRQVTAIAEQFPVLERVVLHGIGEPLLRSEEHTSELQSPCNLVCRLLLEKTN